MLDTSTHTPERSDQRSRGLGELNREPGAGKVLSGGAGLWRVVVHVLTAAATLALLFFLSPGLRSDLTDFVTFVGSIDAASIKEWILSFGTLSPLVYFLIVVGQVILNPIPAGPVTLAGALVFGVWEGLALSMAGSVIGSILVFAAVRRWGEPLLLRVVDEKTYARYADRLGEGGWWFFLLMLLPLMPDDAVCALAGLSAMSLRRYVAFMVVGRLPGATLTSLLASDAITASTAGWITAGLFLSALLALGLIYRGRLEGWILRRTGDGSEGESGRWNG
jgi:uncharacterized membrane protein YdjX (TVP38/TMEM64 family)